MCDMKHLARIRDAYEILSDPVKMLLYDTGPAAATVSGLGLRVQGRPAICMLTRCAHCKTTCHFCAGRRHGSDQEV